MRCRNKKGRKRRDALWTVGLVLMFLAGLFILLYPTFSNWWNTRGAKEIISEYEALVAEVDEKDYSAYFEAAEAYNEALAIAGSAGTLTDPTVVEGYEETLDITGTGIMGYITIEKIDVELPIYHGTSSSVLQNAAGHLEGSSLPVGGESTHSVISAHRGLPSALLFTRLDEIEEGDTFTITVLDQVYTYEVDLISVVEPYDLEKLYIEERKDYCTLLTCTPYGINSQRLLVRGVRTQNADTALIQVTAEAYRVDTIIVASVTAVPLLVILFLGMLVKTRRKRR